MKKVRRGRPPLKRPADEKILQSGLTVGQKKWLNRNFKRYGFESGTHMLRFIVNQAIARSERDQGLPAATRADDLKFDQMIDEFNRQ